MGQGLGRQTKRLGRAGVRLARAGESHRAEELLRDLQPGDQYGAPIAWLLFHLVCSEIDRAADWAWKVFEQRDPRLISVIVLLRAASPNILRSNARWSMLANTLGVPSDPAIFAG
jgi:hypothetical protein